MRIRVTTAATALLAAGLAPIAWPAPAAAAPAKHADDFNGDGHRDLAVGNRGATVGGASKAGAVAVVYGSASGLDFGRLTTTTSGTCGARSPSPAPAAPPRTSTPSTARTSPRTGSPPGGSPATAPPTSRSSATTGTPAATASGSTRADRAAPPRPRR
ncbi:integrin alpha [Streptomyces thermolineatus]|uniref:FG-GAP repeat protein n=1 Tax=Streptomyces thermolineatus TaxID=44033 RepID=UPI0031DA2B76